LKECFFGWKEPRYAKRDEDENMFEMPKEFREHQSGESVVQGMQWKEQTNFGEGCFGDRSDEKIS